MQRRSDRRVPRRSSILKIEMSVPGKMMYSHAGSARRPAALVTSFYSMLLGAHAGAEYVM
jgi:hypothetical protein